MEITGRCLKGFFFFSERVRWSVFYITYTLLGTNISPEKSILKMIFLFLQVGYVNFLEGILCIFFCVSLWYYMNGIFIWMIEIMYIYALVFQGCNRWLPNYDHWSPSSHFDHSDSNSHIPVSTCKNMSRLPAWMIDFQGNITTNLGIYRICFLSFLS